MTHSAALVFQSLATAAAAAPVDSLADYLPNTHGTVRIRTSATGSMLLQNCAERLRAMQETVRKNWALFGGGAKPADLTRKPAPKVDTWSASMMRVWAAARDDKAWSDVFRIGADHLGALFFMGSKEPLMYVAPMPVDGLPSCFVSARREDGRWVVMSSRSGGAFQPRGYGSRKAAEEVATELWGKSTEESRANAEQPACGAVSADEARAAWLRARGVVEEMPEQEQQPEEHPEETTAQEPDGAWLETLYGSEPVETPAEEPAPVPDAVECQAAPTPVHSIGQLVKLTKPGLSGPINIAGTIERFVNGRLEIRTQNDGILLRWPGELGHIERAPSPTPEDPAPTAADRMAMHLAQSVVQSIGTDPDTLAPALRREASRVLDQAAKVPAHMADTWREASEQLRSLADAAAPSPDLAEPDARVVPMRNFEEVAQAWNDGARIFSTHDATEVQWEDMIRHEASELVALFPLSIPPVPELPTPAQPVVRYLLTPRAELRGFIRPEDREYFGRPVRVEVLEARDSSGLARVRDPARGHTYSADPRHLVPVWQLTRRQAAAAGVEPEPARVARRARPTPIPPSVAACGTPPPIRRGLYPSVCQ